MFLKSLAIVAGNGETIREIEFSSGLNLIVDDTPPLEKTQRTPPRTGNNVGKTTVLRLIDFCLGGDPKRVYSDPENPRAVYTLVKDFLTQNEVLVRLVLTEDLTAPRPILHTIERNFLRRSEKVQRVDGELI